MLVSSAVFDQVLQFLAAVVMLSGLPITAMVMDNKTNNDSKFTNVLLFDGAIICTGAAARRRLRRRAVEVDRHRAAGAGVPRAAV